MSWTLEPEQVLRAIRERGLLAEARIAPSGVDVDGQLEIDDRVVTIRVRFSSALALPTLWLEPPNALGVLPHLDHEICYQDKEGLVLNHRDPGSVLAFAIDRARDVLEAGVAGTNQRDFSAEFATIWGRNKSCETVFSLLDSNPKARAVTVVTSNEAGTFVADDEDVIRDFFGGGSLRRDRTIRRGAYLPLRSGTIVVPPPPRGSMWSAEESRTRLLPGLTNDAQEYLRRLSKKKPSTTEYAFFGLPTGHGGRSLFGLKYAGVDDRYPLSDGADVRKVVPLKLRRYDRSFLVSRGGGMDSLSRKRVLLVGCGSVGGLMVQGLSHFGIGELHLVDAEMLSEENTFRHLLGREYWGRNKAQSLGDFVKSNVPYLRVDAFPGRIEELIDSGQVILSEYDLVAIALGNPTIEMHLNELLIDTDPRPLTVHAWLEPLGLGGHAMLTGTQGGGGCFECALTSIDDPNEDRVRDRLSFAEKGQDFGRELSGCGSVHTPYSFGDASKTANQALQLAISALRGNEPVNVIESWKGNAQAFLDQGFKLSARFELDHSDLLAQRQWNGVDRCRACGRLNTEN